MFNVECLVIRDMKKIILGLLFMMAPWVGVYAHAWGTVLDDKGEPLVGANVYWAGTTVGVATDLDGHFKLEPVESTRQLVTSFMGFHNDTTEVTQHSELTIVLVSDLVLEEVNIVERKMAVLRSRLTPLAAFQTVRRQVISRALRHKRHFLL